VKYVFTVLIMISGIIAIGGVVFLFEWASENIRWFILRRPKLGRALNRIGIIFFCALLVCSLVGAYLEIYKLL